MTAGLPLSYLVSASKTQNSSFFFSPAVIIFSSGESLQETSQTQYIFFYSKFTGSSLIQTADV